MQISLTKQHKYVLDLIQNTHKHIFLTGKAGTGKSTLLQYFKQHTDKNYVVLAPTGAAAVNVMGQTIHSFFHFTPGITADEARRTGRSHKETKLFQKLQLLIIDEVSMVRADLLDYIDIFLREAKQNNEPFGGVQMLFIGDLYQLPPVLTSQEQEIFAQHYDSPYFFSSVAFRRLQQYADFYEHVELQKVFRQSDHTFINMLNAIRDGQLPNEHMRMLNMRVATEENSHNQESVYLVSTNKQADEINKANLEKLKDKEKIYPGRIDGNFDNKSMPTDIELKLKMHARVMFLNNDSEERWINGTLGEVVGMYEDEGLQIVEVKKDNGATVEVYPHTWTNYHATLDEKTQKISREAIGSYTQFPLKLAWAITIHKSQGKTFDKVTIDIGWGTFASGQMYVALSRCRTLEGIVLKKPIYPKHIMLDRRIKEFAQSNTSADS